MGVQDAIDQYFPMLPAFFGRPQSRNNEIFRKWGIKKRKNEEMRAAYLVQAESVVKELGMRLPDLA